MKVILGIFILISASFSAQEKRAKTFRKSDTLRSEMLMKDLIAKNPDILKTNASKQPSNIYKMQVAKPKDTSVYLSLKEGDKDYSKHKILNSITPELPKKEIKK
ncbi:MAG: hypothetical protein K0R77_79 [Chryseobacterium sp.]|jgi:hypothetical protein|uniref:hypothetical protein n=1 Tax=Chryseobacterium sp. TaxID=1871047 RepID=UPI0026114205|nr:hypothetical protein [Chryseobacterium sp.]MDF2550804.1 hypothetical protein [Chryseobacterium sp.]